MLRLRFQCCDTATANDSSSGVDETREENMIRLNYIFTTASPIMSYEIDKSDVTETQRSYEFLAILQVEVYCNDRLEEMTRGEREAVLTEDNYFKVISYC